MKIIVEKIKINIRMAFLAAAIALVIPYGAQAKEKELVIGVADALTGPGAVYGLHQNNAIRLAAKEINAEGGVEVDGDNYMIEVVSYDDKGNPTEATNAVRKLIGRDGAKYILGFCCSGATGAVASFIGRQDAVMLVGNAAERMITAHGLSNLFRTRPPADYTGAAAGTFVAERGIESIAVIGALETSLYAQYLEAFEREFVKGGGTIVAKEVFNNTDRNMASQLTKVRSLNPDALLVVGYVEQAAFVYRQADELGMDMPRYGFTSGSEEQFLTVASSEQMEGVWDLRPTELALDALGETAKNYYENYKDEYGVEPTPSSPYAYDQMYVLKHALESAGTVTEVDKVVAQIQKSAVPPEAVMHYLATDGNMFDENGQAYTSNGAFQWQEGSWNYVDELPSDPSVYSDFLKSLRK